MTSKDNNRPKSQANGTKCQSLVGFGGKGWRSQPSPRPKHIRELLSLPRASLRCTLGYDISPFQGWIIR